jgi:hypothetical protein
MEAGQRVSVKRHDGSAHMGTVHEAKNDQLGHEVTVKFDGGEVDVYVRDHEGEPWRTWGAKAVGDERRYDIEVL